MTGERGLSGHLPRDFPYWPAPVQIDTSCIRSGAYAPAKNTLKRGFSTGYFTHGLIQLRASSCLKAVHKT